MVAERGHKLCAPLMCPKHGMGGGSTISWLHTMGVLASFPRGPLGKWSLGIQQCRVVSMRPAGLSCQPSTSLLSDGQQASSSLPLTAFPELVSRRPARRVATAPAPANVKVWLAHSAQRVVLGRPCWCRARRRTMARGHLCRGSGQAVWGQRVSALLARAVHPKSPEQTTPTLSQFAQVCVSPVRSSRL